MSKEVDLNPIEKQDVAAKDLGRKSFWTRIQRLGIDHKGGICDAELIAYKLMKNSEGQEIRLEKRGIRNGRPVVAQVIHLTENDLRGILAMYQELKNG